MTDITDQDREVRRIMEQIRGHIEGAPFYTGSPREWLRDLREIFPDAPAPTLAEELIYRADLLDNGDPDGDTPHAIRTLATRAEQMEHDLAEARAEVERLTAVNEEMWKTDNYREFRERFLTVQKGAESNAETPDPADVKPGEAWVVECRGERRAAVKDNDDNNVPWNTVNADGWCLPEDNGDVNLIARLVPEPRVITNTEDLDTLAEGSVVQTRNDDLWKKDSDGVWAYLRPEDAITQLLAPVTVLWEPGA